MFVRIIDFNNDEFTIFNGSSLRTVHAGLFDHFTNMMKLVVVDDEGAPGERVNGDWKLGVALGVVPPEMDQHQVSLKELKETAQFFAAASSTLAQVDMNFAKVELAPTEEKMLLKVWGYRMKGETVLEIPFNWEAATVEDIARVRFELQVLNVGIVFDADYGGWQSTAEWLIGLAASYSL